MPVFGPTVSVFGTTGGHFPQQSVTTSFIFLVIKWIGERRGEEEKLEGKIREKQMGGREGGGK
jgi:hypothetical protein